MNAKRRIVNNRVQQTQIEIIDDKIPADMLNNVSIDYLRQNRNGTDSTPSIGNT